MYYRKNQNKTVRPDGKLNRAGWCEFYVNANKINTTNMKKEIVYFLYTVCGYICRIRVTYSIVVVLPIARLSLLISRKCHKSHKRSSWKIYVRVSLLCPEGVFTTPIFVYPLRYHCILALFYLTLYST